MKNIKKAFLLYTVFYFGSYLSVIEEQKVLSGFKGTAEEKVEQTIEEKNILEKIEKYRDQENQKIKDLLNECKKNKLSSNACLELLKKDPFINYCIEKYLEKYLQENQSPENLSVNTTEK